MSKAAVSIRKGLVEAIRYAQGEVSRDKYRVHVPKRLDVRAPLGAGETATGRSCPRLPSGHQARAAGCTEGPACRLI